MNYQVKFFIALFLCFLGIQIFGIEQNAAFSAIFNKDMYSLKKILKQNPELSEMNDDEQTILHVAVLSDNLKAVRVILEAGFSNINQLDKYGKTAMDYAIERNSKKIVRKLYRYKGGVTSYQNEQEVQKVLLRPYKIIFYIGKIFALAAVAIVIIPFVIGLCINRIELCYFAGLGIAPFCLPVIAASLILTTVGILGWNHRLNKRID